MQSIIKMEKKHFFEKLYFLSLANHEAVFTQQNACFNFQFATIIDRKMLAGIRRYSLQNINNYFQTYNIEER